ncbi:MAG: RHS repeat domain-containing protein, partial [Chitinophagales bacterium]
MINIINAIDYYPFGWVMPGRELVSSNKYRFGYQGEFSEKDEEIGWNQFELRSLDTRVGRWMSPDPYHQYASPYMAMGNNPIRRVDPDGGIDEPISLPEISNN